MLLRRLSYLIALLLLVSGCGKTSFLGKRYNNFTAYYNTFYNAKKRYNAGVEALQLSSRQNIDRNQYLQTFIRPEQVTNRQDFDEAIIKSADVLRENATSKWIDDALILIGKSYFYLQNYVGSEQKFQEVIDLGGALEDEARFWLARTLIASNAYSRAGEHLAVSLSREGLSSKWEPMLRLALGELYVRQESWTEAAEELESGLERIKDKNLAARVQFLLAQVYETEGRHEDAGQAYARVLRYKPEYALSYAAQISQVRIEGLYGDSERALRLLRGMERDDKNFDNRAELMYFRGRILQAMGDADLAFFTYDDLLFSDDRTLNAANIRGKVHYSLGELYRDLYVDFVYAAAHFDTARSSLSSMARAANAGGVQVQYAPEAITDSDRQAEIFGNYADEYDQVAHLDSLMWLGKMEDEEFDEFILDLRRKRAEELAAQQREVARRQAEQQFRNMNNAVQQGPRKQIDGPESLGNSNQGFLFYKDQIRLQEGRINFIALWGDRPRVPNWRREDAVRNAGTEATEGQDGLVRLDPEEAERVANNLLPVVDYSDVPRDEKRYAEMEAERALARYELANVLFLSMERPDSAAAWYRMVIDETGDLPVAQRAYYALAEVQRALGDEESARRIYEDVLLKYPDSDFSDQVRERIGLAPVEHAVTDSVLLAEQAYEKAYALWKQKRYSQAVTDMVLLASNYRVPDMQPRALLATGAIYLEWATRDHLDVHSLPLPAVPDSMLFSQGLVDSTIFAPTSFAMPVNLVADSIHAESPVQADSIQAEVQADSIQAESPVQADSIQAEVQADSIQAEIQADSIQAESPVQADSIQAESPVQADSIQAEIQADSIQTESPVQADSIWIAAFVPADSAGANAPMLPRRIDLQNPAVLHAFDLRFEADSLRKVSGLLAEEADSLHALSDSLFLADTLYAFSDSLFGQFQKLQSRSDVLISTADSLAGLVDTLYADLGLSDEYLPQIDSLHAVYTAIRLERGPSALRAPEGRRLKLGQLFMTIKERYPSTPHAQYADQMLRAIVDMRPGRDTTLQEVIEEENMQQMIEAMSDEERYLRGPESLDTTGEGWTLVVGSFTDMEEADRLLVEYREKGYKSAVIQASTRLRVVVGQFPSLDDARNGLEMFEDEFPQTTWFLDIQKPR